MFRIATQVGAAQARGRAQKVAWRPFRPAIDFFLSFEQSGLRNRGKWRLGRIMICPNRESLEMGPKRPIAIDDTFLIVSSKI